MINIAIRRNSGRHPLRPGLSREFALSIEWAEAAEAALVNSSVQNKHLEITVEKFLTQARADHDKHWQPPNSQPGNLPNEEFFIQRFGDDEHNDDDELFIEVWW